MSASAPASRPTISISRPDSGARELELVTEDWVRLPVAAPDETVDRVAHVVRLDGKIDRDRVISGLAERGVVAPPYFSPLQLQPFYRSQPGYRPGDLPVTERVAASPPALPFSGRLADEEVAEVASCLREVIV